MGPANVAPWLEQVGDGLAKKVTIGLDAEISEVADCHQAAQERPEGAAQPDPVAGGDGPATRWLHGAAWNTPDTPQEIHQARWRSG